ncbi:universal stress protein [Neolewinella antarctica]|uniref:Nucleotide-binding universal stress UspA family protein n=1 Tax=Neolewinella antarctica TaxID=442734 RepID=A0ABX0X9E1_9BACT|nr:universal stress protein [Neolewinella antarctica]NJC25603.1 nucleotide-binding universal stress UspA family protein [Neolewinella antarctica]
MSVIKSILVPVDFSEISANSYRYALRLADKVSASVHLLHCLPSIPTIAGYGYSAYDALPQEHQRAEQQISTFVAAGKLAVSSEVNRMPEVDTSITAFGLGKGIADYVGAEEIDLIVMGTKGARDGWDRFFGTNSAFMVGQVRQPLLVLPARAEFRPIKSVCFATNLRESDIAGAERLGGMLSAFKPRIDFLHVHLPDSKQTDESITTFRKAFERPRNGVGGTFKIVEQPAATTGIFAYLENLPHDLLVMVKSDREWWERLLYHSDTKKSAMMTSLPLLIFREETEEF